MDTQLYDLRNYLLEHKGITQREALLNLGIGRLSARIYDLRKSGYNIRTDRINVKTRRGMANVAFYVLVK